MSDISFKSEDDITAKSEGTPEERAQSPVSEVCVKESSNNNSEENGQEQESVNDQDRVPRGMSTKSNRSARSSQSKLSVLSGKKNSEKKQTRTNSAMSVKSSNSKVSLIEDELQLDEAQCSDVRSSSATSTLSTYSNMADTKEEAASTTERPPSTLSVLSVKSNTSAKPTREDITNECAEEASGALERENSSVSLKSNRSAKSRSSEKSELNENRSISTCDRSLLFII